MYTYIYLDFMIDIDPNGIETVTFESVYQLGETLGIW
jgi:hypothetical protein